MLNLERHLVETGRVIQRRYLLQRLVEQGQNCAVYHGFDQVLQRVVAVKVPYADHIPAYSTAIRTTSSFTHPNIVGIYDLIVEPEHLYIVQEYVDGDNFQTLLQAQLSPSQVVDFGIQVCQALLYASSPARKSCHGDLTPAAIMRNRRGLVRVNNFALPSDMNYFASWNQLGGGDSVVSDQLLPWGQMSAGRSADDTRALGLLMYQLLASHSSSIPLGTPPGDGRMRFMRNVPPEVCEVVARAVIRQHPQYIASPEALLAELRILEKAFEPVAPVGMGATSVRQLEDAALKQPSTLPGGKLVASLPGHGSSYEAMQQGGPVAAYPAEAGIPFDAATPAAATTANISPDLAISQQAMYSRVPEDRSGKVNLSVLILAGLIFFVLFFVIGFLIAHSML